MLILLTLPAPALSTSQVNAPLEEDAGMPPPAWCPNAYFRLSFTQHHHHKHLQHGEPMVGLAVGRTGPAGFRHKHGTLH